MNKLEQAARQALEALIKANHFHDYEDEITALREALAQPQGEPVAWMRENEDCTDCFVWERDEEHTIPLYTTPPSVEATIEDKGDYMEGYEEGWKYGALDMKEKAAKVCEDEATKCEKAAQACIENDEPDEVSAVRSTGWKLMVCAAAIRSMK